jgi:hypothetical protein
MYVYKVKLAGKLQEILSLLPPDAASEIGLPSQGILGRFLEPATQENTISSSRFVPNPTFIDFLHSVIVKYALDLPGLCAEAYRQQKGWVYIIDGRCHTPQAEVIAEDIIGAFEVRDGQILPESYRRNNDHLLVSPQGLCKLEPKLQDYLIEELHQLSTQAAKNHQSKNQSKKPETDQ